MISVEVFNVLSGNTFETTTGDVVRIYGIIPPPKGESMSEESADFLKSLIGGKMVQLKMRDRMIVSGMINASVLVRVRSPHSSSLCNVAKRMLATGHARMSDKCIIEEYSHLESLAVDMNRGMWDKEGPTKK